MGVNMPAVLVEMGFLTHPTEGRRLGRKAHQQAIASALTEALHTYYLEAEEESR
jgi:N-acetylmuramoyl-L-alanine amidase